MFFLCEGRRLSLTCQFDICGRRTIIFTTIWNSMMLIQGTTTMASKINKILQGSRLQFVSLKPDTHSPSNSSILPTRSWEKLRSKPFLDVFVCCLNLLLTSTLPSFFLQQSLLLLFKMERRKQVVCLKNKVNIKWNTWLKTERKKSLLYETPFCFLEKWMRQPDPHISRFLCLSKSSWSVHTKNLPMKEKKKKKEQKRFAIECRVHAFPQHYNYSLIVHLCPRISCLPIWPLFGGVPGEMQRVEFTSCPGWETCSPSPQTASPRWLVSACVFVSDRSQTRLS